MRSTLRRRHSSFTNEVPAMNTDRMQGAWKQLRGKMKQKWGELTDDELDRAEGKWDELSGMIQSRYGRKRDEVEAEVSQFREEYERDLPRDVPRDVTR
jgi:uncharacterized protein YjbJ (UPF0337 family)